MNDRKQALEALRDKVKAGDRAGFRKANRAVFSTPCQDMELQMREVSCRHAFHGSIDGAKALHDAVLPEWCWSVDRMGNAVVWYPWVEGDAVSHEVSNDGQGDWSHRPDCASLIAISDALISETPKGETP